MKDTLQVAHEFGTRLADTLNEAGFKPIEEGMSAILFVVAQGADPAPLGGSLNYDKESKWVVSMQMEVCKPHFEGAEDDQPASS